MTDYTPEVRRLLSKTGWRLERRGKGDDKISPATGAHVTADGVMKEAGLGKKF